MDFVKMDFTEASGGSEEEFDEQEMEVALYSQIHHDAGEVCNTWSETESSHFLYDKVTLPIRVGIRELPSRITLTARRQPVVGGNFLAFSSEVVGSKCDQKEKNCKDYTDNVKLSDKNSIENSVVEKDITLTKKIKKTGTGSKNKIYSETNFIGLEANGERCDMADISTKISKDVHSGREPFDPSMPVRKENNQTVREERGNFKRFEKSADLDSTESTLLEKKGRRKEKMTTQQKKKVETLLPFSVTNAIRKPVAVVTQDTVASEQSKDLVKGSVTKVSELSKSNTKPTVKLEQFLEFSKPETDLPVGKMQKKKKPHNKLNAAVKPRDPPVRLRRAPFVAVKYKQDSDTNTDYSDSETSSNPSPEKAKKRPSAPSLPASTVNQGLADIIEEKWQKGHVVTSLKSDKEEEGKSCNANDPQNDVQHETTDTVSKISDEVNDESDDESSSDDFDEESDSEKTSSSEEDFSSEANSDLEFNLDEGVHRLLAKQKNFTAGRWKIDDKDRYNMNSLLSRYFSPKKLQCRNCKVEGHLSRDCPQPMKRPCIFCGIEGHEYRSCPNAICYNCDAPGHRTNECTEPKRRWNSRCDRCWMPGHEEKMCPDRWRQYHITVKHNRLATSSKSAQNPLISCYNCGKKGHLGFECTAPRMNQFTVASYPFIACYDTKKKRNHQKQARVPTRRDGGRERHFHRDTDQDRPDRGSRGPGKYDVEQNRGKWKRKHDREHRQNKRKSEDECHSRDMKMSRKDGESGKRKKRTSHGTIPRTSRKGSLFGKEQRPEANVQQRQKLKDGDMGDDFYEDLELHQVDDNEWWKEKPVKKRGKNKRKTSKFTNADWRRNERHEAELFSTSERDFQRRGEKRWKHADAQWQGQDGQHSSKRFKQSTSGFSRSLTAMPSFQENLKVSIDTRNRSGEFNPGKNRDWNSHQGKLKHSASWPVFQGQKIISDKRVSKNGFRANNERFVTMKNDCNIKISLRK